MKEPVYQSSTARRRTKSRSPGRKPAQQITARRREQIRILVQRGVRHTQVAFDGPGDDMGVDKQNVSQLSRLAGNYDHRCVLRYRVSLADGNQIDSRLSGESKAPPEDSAQCVWAMVELWLRAKPTCITTA